MFISEVLLLHVYAVQGEKVITQLLPQERQVHLRAHKPCVKSLYTFCLPRALREAVEGTEQDPVPVHAPEVPLLGQSETRGIMGLLLQDPRLSFPQPPFQVYSTSW